MARGPRLDMPGTVHHVMARGIEQRRIFRGDRDRRDCLTRLDRAASASGATIYAWCLMPNHIHALVRTGAVPLGRFMQRWVGSFATAFNRRHARVGHLFQNRFKSIVVDEEDYLLTLVRYIHRNPLRAGLVIDAAALDRFPWSGHAVLLGSAVLAAQDAGSILGYFGPDVQAARIAYRGFVSDTAADDVPGANGVHGTAVRRTAIGWQRPAATTRGRERWGRDERALGSDAFVGRLLDDPIESTEPAAASELPDDRVRALVHQAATRFGVTAAEIASRSLRRPVLDARAAVCQSAVCRLGLTLAVVGRALRISQQSVMRAVERNRA